MNAAGSIALVHFTGPKQQKRLLSVFQLGVAYSFSGSEPLDGSHWLQPLHLGTYFTYVAGSRDRRGEK